MKSSVVALVVASLLVAGSAFAGEDVKGKELATSNNCMGCHQEDAKAVGPSFKDIAAKYKDDAEAVKTLKASIKDGSKEKWGGPMAMPAQAQVSDDDAQAIVEWMMSLAK